MPHARDHAELDARNRLSRVASALRAHEGIAVAMDDQGRRANMASAARLSPLPRIAAIWGVINAPSASVGPGSAGH